MLKPDKEKLYLDCTARLNRMNVTTEEFKTELEHFNNNDTGKKDPIRALIGMILHSRYQNIETMINVILTGEYRVDTNLPSYHREIIRLAERNIELKGKLILDRTAVKQLNLLRQFRNKYVREEPLTALGTQFNLSIKRHREHN